MSSQSTNNTQNTQNTNDTNIETLTKQNYDTLSQTLSEKEKSTIKKQFVHIIPTYLISEKKQSNFFSSGVNQKKQLEEYHKLKAEIQTMEEKVRDLEIAKKTKLSKVYNNI